MENSIEINKIKEGVTKYISDKSSELKDVIMTNVTVSPLNQQEITSKLKSLSNYQINPAQYLNGLVKSNSTYSSSQASNQTNQSVNITRNSMSYTKLSNQTPRSSYASHNSLNTIDQQFKQSEIRNESLNIDLDNIPDDDTFKSLSIKWWGIDQDGDSTTNISDDVQNDSVLIDVQMSSCNL